MAISNCLNFPTLDIPAELPIWCTCKVMCKRTHLLLAETVGSNLNATWVNSISNFILSLPKTVPLSKNANLQNVI